MVLTDVLTAANLIHPATDVYCPCGDLLVQHAHSDEGQHGQSVSQGQDRGRAVNERRCRSCGLSLTVEVWA